NEKASRSESLLNSPETTVVAEAGSTANGADAVRSPDGAPVRIWIVAEPELTTTTSVDVPTPYSPAARSVGASPTANVTCGANVPSPAPSSRPTVSSLVLTTTTSSSESSSKSPRAIAPGLVPTGNDVGAPKLPSPAPSTIVTSS